MGINYTDSDGKKQGFWLYDSLNRLGGYSGNYINNEKDGLWIHKHNEIVFNKEWYSMGRIFNRIRLYVDDSINGYEIRYKLGYSVEIHNEEII